MNSKKGHSFSSLGSLDAIRRLHHWLYVVHLQFDRIDRITEEFRACKLTAEAAEAILQNASKS